MLASGSYDQTIKIWNPYDGVLMKSLSGHAKYVQTLAVLNDGRLSSGSGDETIKIWN